MLRKAQKTVLCCRLNVSYVPNLFTIATNMDGGILIYTLFSVV